MATSALFEKVSPAYSRFREYGTLRLAVFRTCKFCNRELLDYAGAGATLALRSDPRRTAPGQRHDSRRRPRGERLDQHRLARPVRQATDERSDAPSRRAGHRAPRLSAEPRRPEPRLAAALRARPDHSRHHQPVLSGVRARRRRPRAAARLYAGARQQRVRLRSARSPTSSWCARSSSPAPSSALATR